MTLLRFDSGTGLVQLLCFEPGSSVQQLLLCHLLERQLGFGVEKARCDGR